MMDGPSQTPDQPEPDPKVGDLGAPSGRGESLLQLKSRWRSGWVANSTQAAQALLHIRRESFISIAIKQSKEVDENGTRKPALIQFGLPKQQRAFFVDPVALGDLSSFESLLEAAKPHKVVMESAPVVDFFIGNGIYPESLISVSDWARYLRPDYPNWGFESLVLRELGVLTDDQTRDSNWLFRNAESGKLADAQLDYASIESEFIAHLASTFQAMHDEAALPVVNDLESLLFELDQSMEDCSQLREDKSPRLATLDAEIALLTTSIISDVPDRIQSYVGENGMVEYRGLQAPASTKQGTAAMQKFDLALQFEGDLKRANRSYHTTFSAEFSKSGKYNDMAIEEKLKELAFFKEQRLSYLDPRESRLLAVLEYRIKRMQEMMLVEMKSRNVETYRSDIATARRSPKNRQESVQAIISVPDHLLRVLRSSG